MQQRLHLPGVALGLVASGARRVTDRMFLEAAKAVAALVAPSDLAIGRLLPPLASIREVSAHVALAVAEVAFHDGHASVDRPADPQALVRSTMWYPAYPEYA